MQRRFETMADMLTKSVQMHGPRPFIAEKKNGAYQWLTYREFGALVDAARGGLAALGVQKGDRVAIIADNCTPWAVLAFASYGLGAIWVPMYEAQMPHEWAFIIRDCEAKIAIAADRNIAEKLLALKAEADPNKGIPSVQHIVMIESDKGIPPGVTAYDHLLETGRQQPVPQAQIAREDLADLIYTSGTTGKPKGVMLTHANITDNINAVLSVFPIDENGETSVAFLPWAHAFGQICELFLLFSVGGSIALAESPLTLVQNIGEIKPTILYSVPRVWNKVYANLQKTIAESKGLKKKLAERAFAVAAERERLQQQGKSSLLLDLQYKLFDKLVFSKVRARLGGRLKFAVSGAAALSPEVARFVSYVGITVCEGYGLTETSPAATFNPPGKVRIGTVGIPIPGVEVRIEKVADAPEGQGEIVIKGHNIMKGYYKRDEENAKVFMPDGAFRTGDLGFIDAEGYLHITGRVKEQYKLENGKYVAPAPLEEQLKLSPFIAQAFIYGANKPHNVALIVLNAENLPGWAAQNGLAGKSLTDLAKEPAVRKLIAGEIEKYSADFKGFEKIFNFALLTEEFTSENGMLTPTMKVKRNAVVEKYGALIESLYKTPAAV